MQLALRQCQLTYFHVWDSISLQNVYCENIFCAMILCITKKQMNLERNTERRNESGAHL